MQNLIIRILIFSIVIFSISCTYQNEGVTEEFTVNGLKVILKPNTANETVSAQLYLRGGSLNLDESTQGIEALIFESALKGSKKYPKEELNTILDKTAAQISTNASRDYTSISLRCLNRNFDQTWDVFTDVIMNPTFEEQEVELVRDQLLTGIRQRKDDPDSYLNEIADGHFYAEHVYRFDPQGTEASMAGISIEQMRDHLKAKLQNSQLLLVVAGNMDKTRLKQKVQIAFSQLKEGNYKIVRPEALAFDTPTVKVVDQALPTNYIMGYFPAPSIRDQDYYPMTMTINILSWRLFEEVRTKRNLSYAPSAFFSRQSANKAGIYVTAVDLETTIQVMLDEMRKMQVEPVSSKDLKDRITMYLTRYYLSNETNTDQAQFLARYELSGLGWAEGENFVENLRGVTAEDVQRVANKYFHNVQFAVLGDPASVNETLFTSL